MSTAKKIIKSIISGGFEAVKDSTKQIGRAVGPGALIEAAVGGGKPDEYSDYLKNIGNPNLTGEELEKKKKETAQEDELKKNQLRTFLQATAPHMRLPEKPAELRPAEKIEQEKQQRNAAMAQQQANQPNVIATPAGKAKPGGLFARKKIIGFEGGKKDTKVG